MAGNLARNSAAVVLCSTIAACGSQTGQPLPEPDTPDMFFVRIDNGSLSGTYDTQGFDGPQVQNLIGDACDDGTVATYAEQPLGDRRVAFSATCGNAGITERGVLEVGWNTETGEYTRLVEG